MAREENWERRAESKGYKGAALCNSGLLQLLYHVSGVIFTLALKAHSKCRLLFMSYNGWVMLAVAVGAFIGYLTFGSGSATKTVACH
jgi:copper transporter 1